MVKGDLRHVQLKVLPGVISERLFLPGVVEIIIIHRLKIHNFILNRQVFKPCPTDIMKADARDIIKRTGKKRASQLIAQYHLTSAGPS